MIYVEKTVEIKIKKIHIDAKTPTYATDGSGCFDIYAIKDDFVLPNCKVILPTGLLFEIPKNHVMLLFSRSSHGFGYDIRLGNCVGVIDSDFRGEVKVKLASDSSYQALKIKAGDRICQGLIIPFNKIEFVEVKKLSDTERGEGGFGSTGT